MANLLWFIVVLLIVFWLFGFAVHVAGSFIHIVLVIVIILVLYNLFARRSNL